MQKYIIFLFLNLLMLFSCSEKSELKQPVKSISGTYQCTVKNKTTGVSYNQKWVVDDLGNGRIRVSPQTNIIPAFNGNYADGRIDVIAGYYGGVYVSGSGSGNDNFIELELSTGQPVVFWHVSGIK